MQRVVSLILFHVLLYYLFVVSVTLPLQDDQSFAWLADVPHDNTRKNKKQKNTTMHTFPRLGVTVTVYPECLSRDAQ